MKSVFKKVIADPMEIGKKRWEFTKENKKVRKKGRKTLLIKKRKFLD